LTERTQALQQKQDRTNVALENFVEKVQDLSRQIAVLQEFKKLVEEKEKRNWAIWLAVIGSILTLAANILLLLLRR
jgi:hypothetical protein